MTVEEVIKNSGRKIKSYYLIPNLLTNQTFSEPNWKGGIEYQIIPNFLLDKKCIKHWIEEDGKMMVIVWELKEYDGKKYIDKIV